MPNKFAEYVNVTTAAGETAVGTSTRAILYGFNIRAAAADVTVEIEDGTTDILIHTLDISVEGLSKMVTLPVPVRLTGQMNVTVTGTGGSADVFYGRD